MKKKIQKKEKVCTHEGHYKSAGIVTIGERGGTMILVNLFCEQCGEVIAKDFKIRSQSPPPLHTIDPNILKNMKKFKA